MQKNKRKAAIRAVVRFVHETGLIPNRNNLADYGIHKDWVQRHFGGHKDLIEQARRKFPKTFASAKTALKVSQDETTRNIIQKYIDLVGEMGRLPARQDMIRAGYQKDVMHKYVGDMAELDALARQQSPKTFEKIIDRSIFTGTNVERQLQAIKKYKRFIITTAVVGCEAHKGFLKAINQYCRMNDAMLLVLPAADPASARSWSLDSALGRDNVVVAPLRLNNNISFSTIKMSAKQIDPTTGLARLSQTSGTLIYGSPKQRLKFVATGNSTFPHALMGTGSITLPDYTPNKELPHHYMSERTSFIATHDHVMGAIVAEIRDDQFFYFRQVQADQDGAFIDLSWRYDGDKVTFEPAAAVRFGDWHSGETDPLARKMGKELCEIVRPDELFIEDAFNGLSINPHQRDQIITQALAAHEGLLDLARELSVLRHDIDELSGWATKGLRIVKSNHDIFLERYLQDGGYAADPHNHKIAIKLADAMLEGHDPLKFGVEMMGLKHKDRVKWLQLDDDYRVAGVQMAAHGHLGPNGKRNPSLASIESCYGESFSGHNHTAEILRGAWRVGTSSILKPGYNKGPSSWTRTHGVLYRNGSRQLIHVFAPDGSWTTMDHKKLKRGSGK
jgi:hypothetical protein